MLCCYNVCECQALQRCYCVCTHILQLSAMLSLALSKQISQVDPLRYYRI